MSLKMAEFSLERNGCVLHYWTAGNPAGPMVVLTHGATIDHMEWAATVPLLAEKYRLLTWDVRGHGLSRPAAFNMDEAVLDLLAILDRLDVAKAIFIGHSMGGNLGQELVFHHPERVSAMVFVDCTWNFQKLTPLEKFSLSLAEPIFKLYPYKMLVDQSVKYTATSRESQDFLRASMGTLTKQEFIQIMMATSLCLHYEPGYKIGKPLLLILGDNDRTGNIRKIMPIWAKQEPQAELVIVPHAQHAVNLDQPEIFHHALLQFLDRL